MLRLFEVSLQDFIKGYSILHQSVTIDDRRTQNAKYLLAMPPYNQGYDVFFDITEQVIFSQWDAAGNLVMVCGEIHQVDDDDDFSNISLENLRYFVRFQNRTDAILYKLKRGI